MNWLPLILNMVLVSALSPLSVGIVRKVKARAQTRVGASVLQPYRDLIKLFHKDEVISEDASWIFTVSPYIVFGSTLALAAGLPLLSPALTFAPAGDVLVFVYLLATGAFFLALSGVDTGGGFGGFGGSREMLIAALTEGGLILSLVALALLSGAWNFGAIAAAITGLSGARLLPLLIAGAAFCIVLLSENARYPVDNPATHLELTMVHEAMLLEHSGKGLALMEWASGNKLLIFTVLLSNVFVPWGTTTSLAPQALGIAFALFALKALAILAGVALIESGMAKFRIFRVPDLLFTSFVLSVIALLLIVI
jgi:formate hydrogenlyase subunit 4